MMAPIEVRRLKVANAERMHGIVSMLPAAEWRRDPVPAPALQRSLWTLRSVSSPPLTEIGPLASYRVRV
jgi:hypothetical protein